MSNLSNYPPGVTGMEPQIRGQEDIVWDTGTFTVTDKLDAYTLEGFVFGYSEEEQYRAEAYAVHGVVEVREETAEWVAPTGV